MREIKFRAWYSKDNQMLSWSDLSQSAWNTFRGDTPLSLIYEILVARKDDFNTMQFTGLKDRNGVDIYEGDIVKFQQDYIKPKAVYWNDEMTGFYPLISERSNRLEVIGNIYENPEML